MEMEPPSGEPDRAMLHAALDAVLDAGSPTAAGAGPLPDAMLAVGAVRAALDGAVVRALPAFEASMAWAADGHRSPVSWLVANLGVPRAAAASERRTALVASRMPHVVAAARAGRLASAHLRLLAAAKRSPVESLFDRDEEALVQAALELTADALRAHLDRWYFDALAELGANEPDRDPGGSDRNLVRLRPGFGGRGLLDGDLSAEGRATVEGAIDVEIERWRRDGTLEADPRSWNELRGDALVDLVARGAARPDGQPVRPLVIAVVDIDTLLRRSGAELPDRTVRRADIVGAGAVSDATVAELASRAGLSLLVTGRSGHPLWFGRSRRIASPAQRSAVLAADGGCCYWPGCGAPAQRCQVDHLTGWEQGGGTDIDNLGPICGYHNRLKHRGGYRAARAPDGTIVVTRPDGHVIDPPFRAAS